MTGPTRAGDKSTTPRYGVTLLRWGTGFAGEHGLVEKDLSRGEAHNYSMEVRSDPFESAKSHFFDTSSWGEFCDVTLTLKQAWQPDRGGCRSNGQTTAWPSAPSRAWWRKRVNAGPGNQ